MHPLTCYAGQISLCHAKIEKISKKIFVMINKDGGGAIFGFYGGGHSCYEGDIELMGESPQSLLTRENPGLIISAFEIIVRSVNILSTPPFLSLILIGEKGLSNSEIVLEM